VSAEGEVSETVGAEAAIAPIGDLAPEFRVVVAADRRRGVRLERIFWRLLGEMAERRGQKRSRLIASIIENAQAQSNNTASLLRSFVAQTLDSERAEFAERADPKTVIELLQRAPIPAFAINRQKKLQQVNQEFIQLLRATAGDVKQRISADVVQLTLDTPIDELFLQLATTKAVHCNYSLQLDARQRRGRAKVVAVPPTPSSTLVGYVVS
jgi:predicted DNA-binding ribbon-helix-helix protein